MLRKIDKPIKNCFGCPYAAHNQFEDLYFCDNAGELIGDIDDLYNLPNYCPLPDAGVRVGCVVMIVRDGKVLLGERGDSCETAQGVLAYPGGRMDYGNTPKQSASREVFEETGIVIPEDRLVFLRYVNEFFPEEQKHYVSLVFMAESPASDGPAINTEPDKCKGWGWYDPDEIPKNVFWAVKESIEMYKNKI